MRLCLCVWHKQGMHDYIHLVHATYRMTFRCSSLFCMVIAVIQRIPLSIIIIILLLSGIATNAASSTSIFSVVDC